MRLRALKLIAFGPFRDRALRFENDGGLEVVYGPNEAGKSTTRRAVLALFFGVPERSRDGHSVQDEVRVGGVIEDERGRSFEIVRRKGRKNTLLDPQGAAVDDHVLAGLLSGIGASAYESAYGLDHETLRKGGAALRVGNGELGETLFSAATGLTGLHGVLVELRNEADALFVPSGTKRPLNEALRSFTSAKKRVADLSSGAHKWVEVEKQIDDARAELESLRDERSRAAEERARARATADAARALETHRARAVELESALAAGRAELDAIAPDAAVLARTQAIAALQERLGSHRKAQLDRPKVEAELEVTMERARRAKRDAPRASGELPAAAHVQKLALEGASIRERARAAEASAQAAAAAAARAGERAAAAREVREANELRDALERVQREGDLQGRLKTAHEVAKRARAVADAQIAALDGIEAASVDSIARISVPASDVVSSHARAAIDIASRTRAVIEKRRRLEEDQADAARTIATLRAHGEVPTEAALAKARTERDAIWDDLRETPKNATRAAASRFERALHAADDVADRLRREAARVTRLLELEANVVSTERLLEIARDEERALAAEASSAKQAWDALWTSTSITPRAPDEMGAWRSRWDAAVASALRAHEASEATAPLEAAESAARAALIAALAHEGIAIDSTETLARLEPRAKRLLVERDAAVAERAAAIAAYETATHERERAARELAAFERDRAEWSARWTSATRSLGLEAAASPEEMTAALDAVAALARIDDDADKLRRRLAGIDRDAARFSEDVREVCAACATDLATTAPEEASAELARRVARASEQRARCEALEDQARRTSAQAIEARDAMTRAEEALAGANESAEAAESHALTLDARIADLDDRIQQKSRSLGSVESGAKQFDQSPAIEQAAEAQRQLARVRDLTERYARARIAAASVARLLERFRKENQGPVLARASALFATLTLGAFSGLEVGFGESDEPVLVAIRDGRRLETTALSDGTLDQLYLALRVASLERLTDARGALPLLLDDVLVHFDDQRAAAALAVLADLATRTQVIVFTHHERVVELAKRGISDRDGSRTARVHDLGARAP